MSKLKVIVADTFRYNPLKLMLEKFLELKAILLAVLPNVMEVYDWVKRSSVKTMVSIQGKKLFCFLTFYSDVT